MNNKYDDDKPWPEDTDDTGMGPSDSSDSPSDLPSAERLTSSDRSQTGNRVDVDTDTPDNTAEELSPANVVSAEDAGLGIDTPELDQGEAINDMDDSSLDEITSSTTKNLDEMPPDTLRFLDDRYDPERVSDNPGEDEDLDTKQR
ncbi:hypothetical protein L1889_08035 [Paenalcaligenes niemegkensis]|uniref:hypothetical protein n=1 Tax=Paenalcaligenes niemegkensis TaxID=2895469 RepID=UPI001EE9A267|nr:hypothetical protein [Paenalcaligenes niemegkensis]MCQ9616665.1 hypothetical protein [Paenalcaligenes niemegkensis]